jgi:hypothetical protein
MHDLVKQHLPEIAALCRKHHVRRLDLFGSALGETFDPRRSDVDFLVEFGPGETFGLRGDYMKLKVELEEMFERTVDLVDCEAIRNPFFKRAVETTRVPVYAAAG